MRDPIVGTKMKKLYLVCCLWLLALNAHATLISIDIEDKFYAIGDTLTADIYISEINTGFQALIAEFYFDLDSPDSLLSLTSVDFGDKLRVAPFYDSEQFFDNSVANRLTLSEISSAWWDELLAVQDGLDAFVLASVNFNVLAAGKAEFALVNASASDEWGTPYLVSTQNVPVTVTLGKIAQVPEPNSIILIVIALLGCMAMRRGQAHA